MTHLWQATAMSPTQLVDFARQCRADAPGRWWAFVDAWRSWLFTTFDEEELDRALQGAPPQLQQEFQLLREQPDRQLNQPGLRDVKPFLPKTWEEDLQCPPAIRAAGADLGDALEPFLHRGEVLRIIDPYLASTQDPTARRGARALVARAKALRKVQVWAAVRPRSAAAGHHDTLPASKSDLVARLWEALPPTSRLEVTALEKRRRFHDRLLMIGRVQDMDRLDAGGAAFTIGTGVAAFADAGKGVPPTVAARVPWATAVEWCRDLEKLEVHE